MNPWIGLLISFLFVVVILLISTILEKLQILKGEATRKFVHIGASNWYLVAMLVFSTETPIGFIIAAPIAFILLNYLSYALKLVKSMERKEKESLGTVYFPIALFILVYISYAILKRPEIGLLGMLILGYGDGFAALVGGKYKSKSLIFGKTLYGTLTMFIVSIIVASIIGFIFIPSHFIILAVTVGMVATLVELLTPFGLDNLTVPLLSSLIFYIILGMVT